MEILDGLMQSQSNSRLLLGVDIAVRGVGRRKDCGGGGSRFGAVRRQIEYIGVKARKSLVDWFLVKMSSKKQRFYEYTLRQANDFFARPIGARGISKSASF